MRPILPPSVFRKIALFLIMVGALGSLYFVVKAGHKNHAFLLVILFVFWALSPFMGLLVASVVSNRWSVLARSTLYVLIFLVPVGTLVIYSGAWSPSGVKPAFVFLIVPLVSWLLMAIVFPIAALTKKSVTPGKGGA